MKISKVVLRVIFAGVLLVGCQEGKKPEKAEKPEAAHEAQTAPAGAENKESSAPTAVSAGSVSVADIYAKKSELNGKNVTVHGKVVKVNLGIMGKNWIHLQDGTGSQGTNDITVTTEGQAKVNDKVAVSGTVITDKDFGSGYKYAVMIENATIVAE